MINLFFYDRIIHILNTVIIIMHIKYWKGLVVPEKILVKCKREIEQLESGDYKSLGFEKLHVSGEILYSIRVNRADRLIMTEHAGVLVVLEYVDNHDYAGSPFLNGRGVREYLERKLGLTADEIEAKFAPVADDELAALNARARRDERAHPFIEFHGGRWIELTDIQEKTKHQQLPLVVFGPGGSGKSTIALSMLLQSALEEKEKKPFLFYI